MTCDKKITALAGILALLGLTACQPEEQAKTGVEQAQSEQESKIEFSTGDHCYFSQTDNSTEGLRLTVMDGGAASGQHFGIIHNDENAYYAGFETTLTDGQISGDDPVRFNTETHVDGDHQFGTENWVLTPDVAHRFNWPDNPLCSTPCDGLEARVSGEAPE